MAELSLGDGQAGERLSAVKAAIADSCRAARRSDDAVTLVAVSKTFAANAIRPALEIGHRVFGENRVQEAQGKWPDLKLEFQDTELHLLGPLQSNKTREAIALFDVIESVDREKIARAIAAECERSGRKVAVFLQVNTGEEPQKAGIAPDEIDSFVALCRDDLRLDVRGLMCIPPVDEEAALHFALLEKFAKRNGISGLSMGMSADFEKAIAYGATHVRVGSAIFGARD